jgi:outer membrane protein OmpA-like peptidoglycan-associated protein
MLPADGKTMLLVSDRPGGVGDRHKKGEFFHGGYGGNTDIYIVVLTDGGQTAINLGPTINTPYSEYSPYLSADGKTLYFSSDGHAGLGGLDVFKATRLSDNSWTEWSQPVNLGKDINGPFDDWGYQIALAGNLAYFATNSRIDSYGGNDIYSLEIPEEVRPSPVTTVSGRVLDPDGNPIPGATVVWNDLTLNREVGQSTSAPVTGEYFIALPAGHNYGFYAEKEGYIGKSENLDLTDKLDYAEYHMDIIMHPVESLVRDKVVIRLNNIFFDFDKSTLKEASILELDRWVNFFAKYTDIKSEFQGHADWIGSDAYNQKLSERRAKAVVDYLVQQGVARERVTGVGFGESRPVASNETDEGRAQNRRVEVHFQTAQP